jgi:hypothetical protein
MLIAALSLFGLGFVAFIGAGIYNGTLPDVEEVNGAKRYSFPALAANMTAFFMTCIVVGFLLIAFATNDEGTSDGALNWIMPIGAVGLLAYYLLVERKQQAASFLVVDSNGLHWRQGKDEFLLTYADMASAYLPQMASFKRYFKQGRYAYALTIKDKSGKTYEISPSSIGSARGTRFIVKELRRRLEAAGVPYTT